MLGKAESCRVKGGEALGGKCRIMNDIQARRADHHIDRPKSDQRPGSVEPGEYSVEDAINMPLHLRSRMLATQSRNEGAKFFNC
jgi:hypothetical protein